MPKQADWLESIGLACDFRAIDTTTQVASVSEKGQRDEAAEIGLSVGLKDGNVDLQ